MERNHHMCTAETREAKIRHTKNLPPHGPSEHNRKTHHVIIVEDITYLAKLHQLLPSTHFGGHPGCTTTDSLHFLTNTTKAAWQKEQVVSVLFLDIKGGFPYVVTNPLLHNMRKRRVPEQYVGSLNNSSTSNTSEMSSFLASSGHTTCCNPSSQRACDTQLQ
jgi:hypothetical protein